MRQQLIAAVLAAGLSLGGATAASAQVLGLPVYHAGVPTGLGLAADVGFPNDAAGGGMTYALTGAAGMGPVGVTATVGIRNPEGEGDNLTTLGGTANLKVFGGPLIPVKVSLQAGLGYVSEEVALPDTDDLTYLHIPVGVSVQLSVPNPAFSLRPWIAPRLDMVRVSGGGLADAETESNFGISGGVEMNFINGLGLRAAADWVSTEAGDKPLVFGLGVQYGFRVPGL